MLVEVDDAELARERRRDRRIGRTGVDEKRRRHPLVEKSLHGNRSAPRPEPHFDARIGHARRRTVGLAAQSRDALLDPLGRFAGLGMSAVDPVNAFREVLRRLELAVEPLQNAAELARGLCALRRRRELERAAHDRFGFLRITVPLERETQRAMRLERSGLDDDRDLQVIDRAVEIEHVVVEQSEIHVRDDVLRVDGECSAIGFGGGAGTSRGAIERGQTDEGGGVSRIRVEPLPHFVDGRGIGAVLREVESEDRHCGNAGEHREDRDVADDARPPDARGFAADAQDPSAADRPAVRAERCRAALADRDGFGIGMSSATDG